MRTTIHLAAVIILLGTAGWWWQAGANKGWTKTSVRSWQYDEITEISYPVIEKRFVPGVEFLAGGVIASAVIAGAGFLAGKRRKTDP